MINRQQLKTSCGPVAVANAFEHLTGTRLGEHNINEIFKSILKRSDNRGCWQYQLQRLLDELNIDYDIVHEKFLDYVTKELKEGDFAVTKTDIQYEMRCFSSINISWELK